MECIQLVLSNKLMQQDGGHSPCPVNLYKQNGENTQFSSCTNNYDDVQIVNVLIFKQKTVLQHFHHESVCVSAWIIYTCICIC